jgi:hypothetical protein
LRFRVKSGLSCVAVVSNEDNNNGWDAIFATLSRLKETFQDRPVVCPVF